jgi:hypothetical protein
MTFCNLLEFYTIGLIDDIPLIEYQDLKLCVWFPGKASIFAFVGIGCFLIL